MNITDFIQAIEPLQATTKDASPEEDLQLMSITSIAISLKRIADGLWGTDDTTGLLQLLNPLDVRNNY
jgi:hypothetical protein